MINMVCFFLVTLTPRVPGSSPFGPCWNDTCTADFPNWPLHLETTTHKTNHSWKDTHQNLSPSVIIMVGNFSFGNYMLISVINEELVELNYTIYLFSNKLFFYNRKHLLRCYIDFWHFVGFVFHTHTGLGYNFYDVLIPKHKISFFSKVVPILWLQ